VVSYSILLDATCKESGYKQAMALLDQMRAKGCEQDNGDLQRPHQCHVQ
jgi:pentatricopeptide repeat protein